MTCIVSFIDKITGVVYMVSDACSGDASTYLVMPMNGKVFIKGQYIIGFTGSFRMGQLLQRACEFPEPPDDDEGLHGFMVTSFIEAVRNCFRKHGFLREVEKVDKSEPFLVGVRGHVFYVGFDFQVTESLMDYHAIGCGDQLALGAMHVSSHVEPIQRVMDALKAAAEFSAFVQGPFTVTKLGPKDG